MPDAKPPRRVPRALAIAGAALAGLALAAVAAVALVDGATAKPLAEWAASRALKREVRIGALSLRKGRIFGFDARDVVVRNPDWASGDAARIDALSVDLDPSSLFADRLRLPRVAVDGAVVDLALAAAHGVNWGPSTPALAELLPEERPETPEIGAADLRAVRLRLRDLDAGTERLLEVARAGGSARRGDVVRLDGEGALDGAPLSFGLTGGGFDALVAARDPYPLTLRVAGETAVAVEGALGAGADFALVSARLTASGPDMALLTPILGAPFPATPPYEVSARIEREGTRTALTDLTGRLGDSDVAGWVALDVGGERPVVTGALRSRRLDFDDLAGLVGAAPDPTETASEAQRRRAAEPGLLPDAEPPVAALRRIDADVAFRADAVSSPLAQVRAIEARVRLDRGRLAVAPLTVAVAGGRATGEAALNVREDTPSADVALAFEGVDLSAYAPGGRWIEGVAGAVSGRVYLLGVGGSLSDMAGSARGGGHLTMRGGTVSGLAVEALSLDVLEALGLAVSGDAPTRLRCAALALSAEGGRYRVTRGAAVTDDATLLLRGAVDLPARTLDFAIESVNEDFSLIDLRAAVLVRGPLTAPRVALGEIDPLPFFDLGEPRPSCDAVEAAARCAAPGTP
jgi:uncharacterized protein involved in outer membrane biogenesis